MENPNDNQDAPESPNEADGLPISNFPYSDYFISQEAFLIFVLLHTDGEKRAEMLGVTEELYESIQKAKAWKRSLVKILHSDRCKHPFADEAIAKLNEIYSRMKKHAK